MNNVVSGDVTSCGCVRKQTTGLLGRLVGGSNRSLNFESAKRWLYGSYETRAAKHGRAFEVSYTQFCFLIEQPCYICKAERSNCYRRKGCNYEYRYNGIDRLDSSIGYVDGNMAPCCKDCNYAKRKMSLHEFYRWLERTRR